MRATRFLLQRRQPMIKFLGKRTAPAQVDHTPQPHPEAPSNALPETFANYRKKAQQHGPLGTTSAATTAGPSTPNLPGGRSGASMGPVEPPKGEFFDRDELPRRFRRTQFSEDEMEAIQTGGASMWS